VDVGALPRERGHRRACAGGPTGGGAPPRPGHRSSAPALAARERAKHAAWEAVLAEGLRERGVAAGEARLLGRIAVACYDEALTRWLAQDGPQRTLGAELDAAFAELGALAT